VPFTIYLGTCIPKQCTQSDLSYAATGFSNLLQLLNPILAPKIDKPGLLHPWTKWQLIIRKNSEITTDWKEDTQMGYIAFTAITIPILILFSLLPSLYHIFFKARIQEKLAPSEDQMNEGPHDSSMLNQSMAPVVNNINQTMLS